MIVFDDEVKKITASLKDADGYLDCEHIIHYNILGHVKDGVAVADIESYLKNLRDYFEERGVTNKKVLYEINCSYVISFLDTVLSTPYWHIWIKPIQ